MKLNNFPGEAYSLMDILIWCISSEQAIGSESIKSREDLHSISVELISTIMNYPHKGRPNGRFSVGDIVCKRSTKGTAAAWGVVSQLYEHSLSVCWGTKSVPRHDYGSAREAVVNLRHYGKQWVLGDKSDIIFDNFPMTEREVMQLLMTHTWDTEKSMARELRYIRFPSHGKSLRDYKKWLAKAYASVFRDGDVCITPDDTMCKIILPSFSNVLFPESYDLVASVNCDIREIRNLFSLDQSNRISAEKNIKSLFFDTDVKNSLKSHWKIKPVHVSAMDATTNISLDFVRKHVARSMRKGDKKK